MANKLKKCVKVSGYPMSILFLTENQRCQSDTAFNLIHTDTCHPIKSTWTNLPINLGAIACEFLL